MAIRLINAVRRSVRKTSRTTITRAAPSSRARRILASALSINVAWRKRRPWSCTPTGSAALSSSSTFSTRRLTSRVFAPTCLAIMSRTPSSPSTVASPTFRAAPRRTSATCPNVNGVPSLMPTRAACKSETSLTMPSPRMGRRCVGRSRYPAPISAVASRLAAAISSRVRSKRLSRSGDTKTWYSFTCPP